MRGNFDINNSSYPIAALPVGEKRYRVTNMLYLEPLHEALMPHEAASEIARKANALHRASREQGWKEHGISPEVQAFVKVEVDAFVKAMERVFAQGESHAG